MLVFFLSEGFPAALLLLDVRTDVDIVRAILLLRKEHDNLVNLQRLRSSMMTSESMRVLARGFFFFCSQSHPRYCFVSDFPPNACATWLNYSCRLGRTKANIAWAYVSRGTSKNIRRLRDKNTVTAPF